MTTEYFVATDDAVARDVVIGSAAVPPVLLREELVGPLTGIGILASLATRRSLPEVRAETEAGAIEGLVAGGSRGYRLPDAFATALRDASDSDLLALAQRAAGYREFQGVDAVRIAGFLSRLRGMVVESPGPLYARTSLPAQAPAPSRGRTPLPLGVKVLLWILGVPLGLIVFALAIGLLAEAGIPSPAVTGLLVGIAGAIFVGFLARRRRAREEAIAAAAPGALVLTIGAVGPFADEVARARELLGETSPLPRFTRRSRPVAVVDPSGIVLREAESEPFLTVPVEDIAVVESRLMSLRLPGWLVTSTFPAVALDVHRGGVTRTIMLIPLAPAGTRVPPQAVEAFAAQLTARLGLARV